MSRRLSVSWGVFVGVGLFLWGEPRRGVGSVLLHPDGMFEGRG